MLQSLAKSASPSSALLEIHPTSLNKSLGTRLNQLVKASANRVRSDSSRGELAAVKLFHYKVQTLLYADKYKYHTALPIGWDRLVEA